MLETLEELPVTFRGVTVKVKDFSGNEKVVLDHVSGNVEVGELMAIMGPTGCGKTTLLSALSGRVVSSGRIRYGGYSWSKAMKRRVGFVEQDDTVFESLTVRESLQYSARLRLPSTMTDELKMERVDEVIQSLRLTKCADSVVGGQLMRGVSGGERKRLSIGTEMLTYPRVLYMDEPTSGLDSSIALLVIQNMQELAQKHRMVCVASIHQPSSQIFHVFSKLTLLSEGKLVFHGPIKQVVSYFETLGHTCPTHYNPPDFFMDLVVHNKLNISEIHEAIVSSIGGDEEGGDNEKSLDSQGEANGTATGEDEEKAVANGKSLSRVHISPSKHLASSVKSRYASSYMAQVKILMQRTYRIKKEQIWDSNELVLNIGLGILVSLIYLRIGFDESDIFLRTAMILMVLGVWMWFPFINALAFVPSSEVMVIKELRVASYRLSAWFLAQITMQIFVSTIWIAPWTIAVHYAVGLNDNFGVCVLSILINILSAITFLSTGVLVSAAVPGHRVMTVGVLIISFCFTYCGLFNPNMPDWLYWTEYVNPFAYTYQLAMYAIFDGLDFNCPSENSQFSVCSSGSSARIRFDDVRRRNMNFPLEFAAIMPFAWTFVCLFLSYRFLRRRLLSQDRAVLDAMQ